MNNIQPLIFERDLLKVWMGLLTAETVPRRTTHRLVQDGAKFPFGMVAHHMIRFELPAAVMGTHPNRPAGRVNGDHHIVSLFD